MDVELRQALCNYSKWGGGLGEGLARRRAGKWAGGFLKIAVLPAWELYFGVIWVDTYRHPFGTTFGSVLESFGVAKRGRGRAAGAAEDHCSSQHSFETISLQRSIF